MKDHAVLRRSGPWILLLLIVGAAALWWTFVNQADSIEGTGTADDAASGPSGGRPGRSDAPRESIPGKSTHRTPSQNLLRDQPFVKGALAFQDGDLDRAREEFLQSIADGERVGEAHRNLGLLELSAGDDPLAARTHFEAALAEGIDGARLHGLMAYLSLRLDEPERAVEEARRALVDQPREREWHLTLVQALAGTERWSEAREAADEAFAILGEEKANTSLLQLSANASLNLGEHECAAEYLERLVALDPENASARRLLEDLNRLGRQDR